MKIILLISILLFTSSAFAADVKNADLAGSWYPAGRTELEAMLKSYLNSANPEKIDGPVLAIISPHAGYQFSAPVAAYGYKALQGKEIKTVVIIGFNHRKFFDGISVYAKGAWRTPLGDVAIDEEIANRIISNNKRIKFEPGLFIGENSVEMQVPFVQLTLKDAKVVPIAFGTQDYKDAVILADALANILKDRKDVLVIASTDLSHYHPYEEANSIDKDLIAVLNKMKAKDLYDSAVIGTCELCGMMPVTAVLLAAEKLGFDGIKILKYANSGDVTGDKGKVVGYLSAAIYKKEEKTMLNDAQRKRLLQIARESITSYVRDGKRKDFTESDTVLNKNLGAFVTLHENGELRGCIGNMMGQGPLYRTIADMAIESATGDPRFPRLSAEEIDRIVIEISVLTPLEKVASYKDIKIPGHGVLVRSGFRSGVFLPQVATENNWDREQFMNYLCAHKAGLAPDAWKDPKTELYVFSAEVFGEGDEAK